jgi:hypothetical protein
MKQIPINGIRLGPGMIRVGQRLVRGQLTEPMYQSLSLQGINMVCAGLHGLNHWIDFSGCLENKHRETASRLQKGCFDPHPVCLVSIYPHRGCLQVPAVLIQILDRNDIPFFHLVSSHAVICVVIGTGDQDRLIDLLEAAFDLPPTHTPYLQEIDQDISQFLKKYPETRATYEEEKIKTYGIQVILGLSLYRVQAARNQLAEISRHMSGLDPLEKKFHFVSAIPGADANYELVFLTDPDPGFPPFMAADLISFHGPHFGDRYRILQTALDCLETDRVPLLVAGCTGASISLVVPAGQGTAAQKALARGFEAP